MRHREGFIFLFIRPNLQNIRHFGSSPAPRSYLQKHIHTKLQPETLDTFDSLPAGESCHTRLTFSLHYSYVEVDQDRLAHEVKTQIIPLPVAALFTDTMLTKLARRPLHTLPDDLFHTSLLSDFET